MKFDYERRIQIRELGIATGKPHLSLIGNIVVTKPRDGFHRPKDVGHYLHKLIKFVRFKINGEMSFDGNRKGVNKFETSFIKVLKLEVNDVVRITFDTEQVREGAFLIYVEVPEERYKEFMKLKAKRGLNLEK